jgi:hypothetical protein
MVTFEQVSAAIVRLNNLYGRGDVKEVRYFLDGRIEAHVKKQYGTEKFLVRVTGSTVRARGHQMTIKPE